MAQEVPVVAWDSRGAEVERSTVRGSSIAGPGNRVLKKPKAVKGAASPTREAKKGCNRLVKYKEACKKGVVGEKLIRLGLHGKQPSQVSELPEHHGARTAAESFTKGCRISTSSL